MRHRGADRLYHWLMAVSVLTLLGTAFLPILGWKFAWLDAHWIAGVVLVALVHRPHRARARSGSTSAR